MTPPTHSPGRAWWMVSIAFGLLGPGCGRNGFDLADGGSVDGADGGRDLDASSDGGSTDPSLIAWLQFEDDPSDSVADAAGMNASCVTTCPTRVPGPRGMAYKFDGIGDALVTPDEARFRLTAGTVALWFRLDGWPTQSEYRSLVGKPFSTVSENSWELYLYGLSPTSARLDGGGDAAADSYTQSAWTDGLGAWVHMAMTWDATVRVYLDGVEVASAGGLTVDFDSHPLAIGADLSDTSWSRFVAGSFDDLRVYDRVLSIAEIAALAQ